MKAKCIKQTSHKSYKFFLYMIAPLLIGTLIALTSLANADWKTEESLLISLPSEQGWIEYKGEESILNI